MSILYIFLATVVGMSAPLPRKGFDEKLHHQPINLGKSETPTLHNVQFVKYDVTVSFMAQVLDTVTYLVPQVLDTAS